MDEYIVLDIETTGLSKRRHAITEIAAAKIKKNKIVDEFHSLVNPEVPIPQFITRLTGITNKMVKKAPTISKVLPDFLEFLGSSTIIAHNASFDYGFLNHNSELHLDNSITNPRLCTRKLANRLVYDLPSKRLSCLCDFFKITNEQAHRARADVLATNQVFQNFLRLMKEKEITSHEDIMKFERSPIKR